MRKFSLKSLLLLSFIVLSACGSDSETPQSVDIVFPLGHSLTTENTIQIKGTRTSGVENLRVNGVAADLNQNDKYWFATVNVADEGTTQLIVEYEVANEPRVLDRDISVQKGDRYWQYLTTKHIAEQNSDLVLHLTYMSQLWTQKTDGSQDKLLWDYSSNDLGLTDVRLDNTMSLDSNGQYLYITGHYDSVEYGNNVDAIFRIEMATSQVSLFYGPDDAGYEVFGTTQLVYIAERGDGGQLLLLGNDLPHLLDIQNKSISRLNLDSTHAITGQAYTDFKHVAPLGNNKVQILGTARPNGEYLFWTAALDLSSCDGQEVSCRLMAENYHEAREFPLCAPPFNSSRLRDGHYHQASQRWLYEGQKPDRSRQLCALDLSDFSQHSEVTLQLAEGESVSAIAMTQQHMYLTQDDSRIAQGDLPAQLDNASLNFELFNQASEIGDESVDMQTPRQVLVSSEGDKAFWSDRDLGEIFELDLSTWQWRQVIQISDEILEEGQSPTRPKFRPEESVYYQGKLYVVSDNQKSIFAIDINAGSYEVLLAPDFMAAEHGLDDIEAVALNEAKGILYLANRKPYDESLADYNRFNLLAYDLNTKALTEVSAATLMSEAPAQANLKASYDMVYDSLNERVLFYYSTSDDQIWSVDVSESGQGARAIISFDYNEAWDEAVCLQRMNNDSVVCEKTHLKGQADLSNARGHAMDEANNRLLIASQSSQSILAMDLDTGLVSNLSPETYDKGMVFDSPKGLDLIADSNVALVADESIDALFLVDLDSGQRVLLHNR